MRFWVDLCRLERSVGNIERVRDGASKRHGELHIPWAWMMDTGVVGQVKIHGFKKSKVLIDTRY